MAKKWGSADFKEFEALYERLQDAEALAGKFCKEASKELAARLLALVIPRTHVGVYDSESGKKGGTLRRGWTGGKSTGAKAYAQALPIKKAGNLYTITVINPVEYASYVEFGHRQTPGRFIPAIGKRLKNSWVEGQYMLTLSEDELKTISPKVLQQKLDKYLREVFNGTN